jgi:hypothetical protein
VAPAVAAEGQRRLMAAEAREDVRSLMARPRVRHLSSPPAIEVRSKTRIWERDSRRRATKWVRTRARIGVSGS